MKTDPTPSITGAAGMPLAYQAVQSGRNSAANTNLSARTKEAISDTLETTDREGDGRQALDVTLGFETPETKDRREQDRLDLTG